MSKRMFDEKDPGESVKLTFDFAVDLPPGVTLAGTPELVGITVTLGTDPAATALQNGALGLDVTSTKVIMPATGGVDGCNYNVSVRCPTTDPLLILELDGTLPVRH